MPRSSTGELPHLASGFAARITIEGRERRDFPLPTCAGEAAAKEEERTAALVVVALRLPARRACRQGSEAPRGR